MKEVLRKEDKAVSPIIGTVLLVAITVTLVASLYTILGGYFQNGPVITPSASVKVLNSTTSSNGFINGTYSLFITSVSNNISAGDVMISVTTNASHVYEVQLSSVVDSYPGALIISSSIGGNLSVSVSNSANYLSPQTSITFNEKSFNGYVVRIALIDSATDGTINSVLV